MSCRLVKRLSVLHVSITDQQHMAEIYSNGKSRFIITLMNLWHFWVKVKIAFKIFRLWMFLNVLPELFHKRTLKSEIGKALQKVMKNIIYRVLVINSRKLFKGPCNEGQMVAVVSCILFRSANILWMLAQFWVLLLFK